MCPNILFNAPHIPGWVREINPTRMILKRGLRYHLVNQETGFVCPLLIVDMVAVSFTESILS